MTGKPAIDGVKSEILDLETLESPEDVECRDFPNFPKEIKGSQWVEILLWSGNFKSFKIFSFINLLFHRKTFMLYAIMEGDA